MTALDRASDKPPIRGQTAMPLFVLQSLCILVFLLSQNPGAWRVPFLNEDYAFLDVTRDHSILSLWSEQALRAGPWFRPWSQGFYYWALQHIAGTNLIVWHGTSFCLALVSLVSYLRLAGEIAGLRSAALAAAAASALVGWAVLVHWIAGVQDLWMLALALLTLTFVARDRFGWASVTMTLSLLSKETAVVLPFIAVAFQAIVRARGLVASAKRVAPMWLCLLLWGALYWQASGPPGRVSGRADRALADNHSTLLSAPLSAVNLDHVPAPEQGWWRLAVLIVIGVLALAGLWALGRQFPRNEEPRTVSTSRAVVFGASWAACAWLPLLLPSLNWHSYYGLFGSLGAWLALAVLLDRVRGLALVVIAALVVLRAGRTMTPIHDWGEQSYVQRAGVLLEQLRDDLEAKATPVTPHMRFYFHRIPSETGFLVGDGPSLRVWFNDPTLQGHLWREFRMRGPSDPPGVDRFFRWDPTGWIEIVAGAEDVESSRRHNPAWGEDHERLSRTFVSAQDWSSAYAEYAKLASVYSGAAEFPFMAGLAALAQGDSAQARTWVARAARLPSADDEARSLARALGVR